MTKATGRDRRLGDPDPSPRSCYLQPQLVELAVPQHDAFSDGAQHDSCSLGEQQAQPLPVAGAVVCFCLSVFIVNLPYVSWYARNEHSQEETVDRQKRRNTLCRQMKATTT
jgi:hypothetical protein